MAANRKTTRELQASMDRIGVPPEPSDEVMLVDALEHARDQEVSGRHDWCDDPIILPERRTI